MKSGGTCFEISRRWQTEAQRAAVDDFRAEAATKVLLEKFAGAGSDDAIHPFAGSAFLGALELHTLQSESSVFPLGKAHAGNDKIAAKDRGGKFG